MKHWILGLVATLPTTALAQSRIIDDSAAAPDFIVTGDSWASWSYPGVGHAPSDSGYHYLSAYVGDGDRRGSAFWTPDLPAAGTYSAATWFRRTSNRSPDADFFVSGADGVDEHHTVNQRGDGPSGWVELGEMLCPQGRSSCRVSLVGDDGLSDEANAVRFLRVGATPTEPAPEPAPLEPPSLCSTVPSPGEHLQVAWATTLHSRDWNDRGRATGVADGREATTPNADAGEFLRAGGWTLCDPPGAEVITRVELSARARTQYDSGPYDVRMRLHAGGEAALVWHGRTLRWRRLDVTADRPAWTWSDVLALRARLQLEDHPQGRRDSDIWVDAFSVRVWFVAEGGASARDDGAGEEPDEVEGGWVESSDWFWEEGWRSGTNGDDIDLAAEQDTERVESEVEEALAAEVGDADADGSRTTGVLGEASASGGDFDGDGPSGQRLSGCTAGTAAVLLLPFLPMRRRRGLLRAA